MTLDVRPLHPIFAAEIVGFDATRPIDPETLRALWGAIDTYAVVVLRDQHLDNESQLAFARNFGDLEVSGKVYRSDNLHRNKEHGIVDVSNLDENNQPRPRDDRRRLENLRNYLWHTDASFREVPGALSMLYGHRIPPKGGNTEFADLRAAYDALDDEMKAKLRDLIAIHSYANSRTLLGVESSAEESSALPPVKQRVVRLHPGSNRRTLYIGAHATSIVGWPVPEGRLLLNDLLEHATRREFVYSHQWRQGDLVIWDNRCTLHRARPFDESYPRDVRRVTTKDVASTLEQSA